jgi:hypothetical protein
MYTWIEEDDGRGKLDKQKIRVKARIGDIVALQGKFKK